MASDPHDIETEAAPEARRRAGGGCTPVAAILLLAILAVLAALVWLRGRQDVPNPAMSGHPPTLPAH
jgi:hypothetical protein